MWNESFVDGSVASSRFGIEVREADGSRIIKQYITPENSNASFPVICTVDATNAPIAYT